MVDWAPHQVVAWTPITMVVQHFLMLYLDSILVTSKGQLKGIITIDRIGYWLGTHEDEKGPTDADPAAAPSRAACGGCCAGGSGSGGGESTAPSIRVTSGADAGTMPRGDRTNPLVPTITESSTSLPIYTGDGGGGAVGNSNSGASYSGAGYGGGDDGGGGSVATDLKHFGSTDGGRGRKTVGFSSNNEASTTGTVRRTSSLGGLSKSQLPLDSFV
jgi:hypothetical protein